MDFDGCPYNLACYCIVNYEKKITTEFTEATEFGTR